MSRWWPVLSLPCLRLPCLRLTSLVLTSLLPASQLLAAEPLATTVPLPTTGAEQHAVVSALIALGQGDPAPLLALPHHVVSEPPAIIDPQDPDLARRWTLVVPAALARLPADRRAAVSTALGWEENQEQRLARAFDRGRMIDVLILAPADPRAAVARSLLGLGAETLPEPAIPLPGSGSLPTPPPLRLAHGDGWLFGLDEAGPIRWQRRCERMARVALGVDGALVAEASGLFAVDLAGVATRLPPLPSFARPLAYHGGHAWFVAGSTLWRLALPGGAVATLNLGEPPLGVPLLHGSDGWWLTPSSLIHTHDTVVIERLPHLLALSPAAAMQADPRGAVVRDGDTWWLVGDRAAADPATRINSELLAGHRVAAQQLLTAALTAGTPIPSELRVRVTLADPDTAQERAVVMLARNRDGLDQLPGNPLLTEPGTDLALPVAAWRHHVSLAAWKARAATDTAPDIRLRSDATTVRLTARWSAERFWERTWPVHPLLDAPARSWAQVPGAIVAVDGAVYLVVADDRTGELVVAGEMPCDIEPTLVVRTGPHAAAALVEQGRTLLDIHENGIQRRACPFVASSLTLRDGALELSSVSGEHATLPLLP